MDTFLIKSPVYQKILTDYKDGIKPSELKAKLVIDSKVKQLQAFFMRRILKMRRDKKMNLSAGKGFQVAQFLACFTIQKVITTIPHLLFFPFF